MSKVEKSNMVTEVFSVTVKRTCVTNDKSKGEDVFFDVVSTGKLINQISFFEREHGEQILLRNFDLRALSALLNHLTVQNYVLEVEVAEK